MIKDWHKFIIEALLVVGIVTFGVLVALGKVEEKSSYGLTTVLVILSQISKDIFSGWASKPKPKDDKPDDPNV